MVEVAAYDGWGGDGRDGGGHYRICTDSGGGGVIVGPKGGQVENVLGMMCHLGVSLHDKVKEDDEGDKEEDEQRARVSRRYERRRFWCGFGQGEVVHL